MNFDKNKFNKRCFSKSEDSQDGFESDDTISLDDMDEVLENIEKLSDRLSALEEFVKQWQSHTTQSSLSTQVPRTLQPKMDTMQSSRTMHMQ